MSRRAVVLIAAVAALAMGCTVPSVDQATVIDQEELPADLQPSETLTPTTAPPVEEEDLPIYFIQGGEQAQVAPVLRSAPEATLDAALETLFVAEPTGRESRQNLTNLLFTPPDEGQDSPGQIELVRITPQSDQVVAVRIRGDIQGELDTLRRTFAQIVFTATEDLYEDARPCVVLVQDETGDRISITTDDDSIIDGTSRADFATLDPDPLPPRETEGLCDN